MPSKSSQTLSFPKCKLGIILVPKFAVSGPYRWNRPTDLKIRPHPAYQRQRR
jgi:hypothetical protein